MRQKILLIFTLFLIMYVFILPYTFVHKLKNKDYSYYCKYLTCDVYLSNTIESEEKYIDLYKLINEATSIITVNLHLSGNGGYMSTVYHLANAIEHSNATINTIVEGPVYSAHAMIAMMGDMITVDNYAQFMFHTPAVDLGGGLGAVDPAFACTLLAGKFDRGQDSMQKCLDREEGEHFMFQNLYDKYLRRIFTKDEARQFWEGCNIYLPAQEIKNRLNK